MKKLNIPVVTGLLLLSAFSARALQGVLSPAQNIIKVQSAVEAIKRNKLKTPAGMLVPRGPEKTFTFTEAEVNEYLQFWIQEEARRKRNKEFTVKSGTLRLRPGNIIEADAVARLGVGAIKSLGDEAESATVKLLKEYVSMDNTMHLEVMVSSAKGKAFLQVREAKIKGIPLPNSLVHKILQIVGQKQRPPLDFNQLIDLPNGIQKIEVLPEALKLKVKIL